MGRDLAEAFPAVRAFYDEADDILGVRLSRICFDGPEEELVKTVNTQPAIYLHSVAVLRLLIERGFRPGAVAGHSLGEYSACVAAGALDHADALRLVRRRGELMYEAGLGRPGAMAAVMGLDGPLLDEALEAGREAGTVVAANLNSPGQVVLSGDPAAVEKAMEAAKAFGAKRAMRLAVSGAFHSPLMEPAAAGLREALDRVPIRDAAIPVFANVTAAPGRTAAQIRDALAAQLVSTVRWEESMRAMLAAGAGRFLEVGPGKVMRGLLRNIDRDAPIESIGDPASLRDLSGCGPAAAV
jgi:[acyl-carrier-protein] S-malonyltransferase